ncbi:MAG: acyltransferase [Alphaproteobacteria bacterium]|nr:acyltransferase [Alphaproteobacteria bacterium]MBP7759261.1 acyltransferase [Alphaproteobacteria bacterium]MBP7761895.1 acyltransferase [Alphaproteobacteria bacterium]
MLTRTEKKFPKDIVGLTSLRFYAVFYVILFHYHFLFSPAVDLILSKGYLAVDFFFILSGFILAHCYLSTLENKTFTYRHFLIKRIARIYPVHLFTLALMLVIFGINAVLNGPPPEDAPNASNLAQNIILVHSWGLAADLSFNRYSWTISAEFFAYLLFPFLMSVFISLRRPELSLLLSFTLYGALWLVSEHLWNQPLSKMSVFGLPRILPEFMIGIGLYLFSLRYSLKWCRQVFMGGCVVALFCGLLLEIGDWIAVPLFALMIYATAEQSRTGQKNFLFENSSVYLGEISYSLYMIQYPFMFIVFDTILERGLGLEENSKIWGYIWAAAPLIMVLLAMAMHKYIESPCRHWLVRRISPSGTEQKATGDAAKSR